MNPEVPKENENKSVQFHQIVNVTLTIILGSSITALASFFYSVNNSLITLTTKFDTASTNLDKLSITVERRVDKLEDRIRAEEMKR